MVSKFERCVACLREFYCPPGRQHGHWDIHKRICQAYWTTTEPARSQSSLYSRGGDVSRILLVKVVLLGRLGAEAACDNGPQEHGHCDDDGEDPAPAWAPVLVHISARPAKISPSNRCEAISALTPCKPCCLST